VDRGKIGLGEGGAGRVGVFFRIFHGMGGLAITVGRETRPTWHSDQVVRIVVK
jgi:hypothetical protein